MDNRSFLRLYARVLLADCAARRHWPASRSFYWFQFAAAQQARRKLAGLRSAQGELFA